MSEYEAELRPIGLGYWTYKLFRDGKSISGHTGIFTSRSSALAAATQAAHEHRDGKLPQPSRVVIELD